MASSDDYLPSFNDANDVERAVYSKGRDSIVVSVHTYSGGDRELIRAGNTFIGTKGHKIMRDESVTLIAGKTAFDVGRIDMLESGSRRTIMYWYQIGNERTLSPNVAKFREWAARLSGKPTRRAVVSVSAPVSDPDVVPEALRRFVELLWHGAAAMCSDAGCG